MGDPTKDLNGNRPFEERVFARFDAMEEYLRSLDARVEVIESRGYDTKPIWERALKEILETRAELGETRAELAGLTTNVAAVETRMGGLEEEVNELRRYIKREVANRLDQIQVIQLENRQDIRDVERRLDKVEPRLA